MTAAFEPKLRLRVVANVNRSTQIHLHRTSTRHSMPDMQSPLHRHLSTTRQKHMTTLPILTLKAAKPKHPKRCADPKPAWHVGRESYVATPRSQLAPDANRHGSLTILHPTRQLQAHHLASMILLSWPKSSKEVAPTTLELRPLHSQ